MLDSAVKPLQHLRVRRAVERVLGDALAEVLLRQPQRQPGGAACLVGEEEQVLQLFARAVRVGGRGVGARRERVAGCSPASASTPHRKPLKARFPSSGAGFVPFGF